MKVLNPEGLSASRRQVLNVKDNWKHVFDFELLKKFLLNKKMFLFFLFFPLRVVVYVFTKSTTPWFPQGTWGRSRPLIVGISRVTTFVY